MSGMLCTYKYNLYTFGSRCFRVYACVYMCALSVSVCVCLCARVNKGGIPWMLLRTVVFLSSSVYPVACVYAHARITLHTYRWRLSISLRCMGLRQAILPSKHFQLEECLLQVLEATCIHMPLCTHKYSHTFCVFTCICVL